MSVHFHKIFKPTNLLAAVLITALPAVSQAVAITYDIQNGSAPSFSGSWIHSADNEMGSSGYFTNGTKTRVAGSITITDDLSLSTGQLTATGNFGSGNDSWTIDLFNGASSTMATFVGGDTLLLSLDYTITGSSTGLLDSGTFYFASRDFNSAPISNGPNYFDSSVLYLWGNNWINEDGTDANRPVSTAALGLDIYGVAVPEPTIALLLGLGLLGIASRRLIKST